jgi:hypothetical protein
MANNYMVGRVPIRGGSTFLSAQETSISEETIQLHFALIVASGLLVSKDGRGTAKTISRLTIFQYTVT